MFGHIHTLLLKESASAGCREQRALRLRFNMHGSVQLQESGFLLLLLHGNGQLHPKAIQGALARTEAAHCQQRRVSQAGNLLHLHLYRQITAERAAWHLN